MKIKIHGANQTEVIFANDNSLFFSYEKPVASYVRGCGFRKTEEKFSVTTSKHINKWLKKVGNGEATTMTQNYFDTFEVNFG